MRNRWRLLAFDILAPLAAVVALLAIGVVLAWPLWWVSVCSVLVLLIVEAMAVNFWLLRRDSVSVGTDDDAPRLDRKLFRLDQGLPIFLQHDLPQSLSADPVREMGPTVIRRIYRCGHRSHPDLPGHRAAGRRSA